jgi:hypothetical protein
VGVGVAGPGGGVAGDGVDQAAGAGGHRRVAPPATLLDCQSVQVVQRGIPLGVEDAVHVLGPPDDPQLGHALVGGDHQLHARALRAHQALAGGGVDGAARAVEGVELRRGHAARQSQRRSARAPPHQGRLASRGVVLQGLAGMVVGPEADVGLVVGHRVGPHHRHERHRAPDPAGSACNRLRGLLPLLPYYWCDCRRAATEPRPVARGANPHQ